MAQAKASIGPGQARKGAGLPKDQALSSKSQKSSSFGPQCWNNRGACGPVTSGVLQHRYLPVLESSKGKDKEREKQGTCTSSC
ncbi:hypothetical protein BGAL_0303g00100 [Botrytis galanthina]|uniref:Uncharacterized protein n=1 Tax=Botrytis galanthina TaxID=278940 RepID=A0A4S8QQZ0_9HELO|nr:hypothetical protein BGAL_0303g00100 [Botrytis galanthina]